MIGKDKIIVALETIREELKLESSKKEPNKRKVIELTTQISTLS